MCDPAVRSNCTRANQRQSAKAYSEGQAYLNQRRLSSALDSFRKADKEDGGHCRACQEQMIKYGVALKEWKTAEIAGNEIVAAADNEKDLARAHLKLGMVLINEGLDKKKEGLFNRAHDELAQALKAVPDFSDALFADGVALAHLKQDDAASAQFQKFADLRSQNDVDRRRALRFVREPALARARMAPPFSLTTLDGERVSLDDLTGSVVLIDFWATWCGPCRAAVPHIRDIAKKFQGQPLKIISINLDNDKEKGKDYILKNDMTWSQYCDGGFEGPMARAFDVNAIPHTFIIDADGVLQEEDIGDAAMDGKLKKLVAHTREIESAQEHKQ